MSAISRSKHILFLGILLGVSICNCFAQTDSISSKTFVKKINQAFGVIATGQSEAANLVNYGSFEPVNGAFKLNIFGPIGKVEKKGIPFFSASASGNLIGETSTSIFDNSKLNNGVTLAGKLHIPIVVPNPVISGNQEQDILDHLKALADKLRQKHYTDSMELDYHFLAIKSISYNNLIAQKNLLILQKQHIFDSLNKLLALDTTVADSILSFGMQIQQLRFDREDIQDKQNNINTLRIDTFARRNRINKIQFADNLAYQKVRDSLENTINVRAKSFFWITPTATIGRKKYYTFDDSTVYSGQLKKLVLTTYTIGVEFNFISLSEKKYALISEKSHHTHVVNLGIVYSRNNNIEDLTTTELSDSRKYSAKDSAHSLAQKYSVYTDSVVEYKAFKLYANYYYYFGKTNNFALHFSPDVELRDTKLNPLNLSLGFIIAYKNKKDNTIANIELYTKFVDIGDALHLEEQNWINRNVIGVNFGVPLNIFSLK